jgi:hypothetical protein
VVARLEGGGTVADACGVADACWRDGDWKELPAAVRGAAGRLDRGVPEDAADVAGAGAEDAGPARRAAASGDGALVAAALCPLSATASAMTAPAAASAPPVTTAPDRKLISSIRA